MKRSAKRDGYFGGAAARSERRRGGLAPSRKRAKALAGLELLEDRRVMSTLTWVGDVNGNWNANVAGNTNWSGDVLPADGDTLIFPLAGVNKNQTNDTAADNHYFLTFADSGYTIGGNRIALAGANAVKSDSPNAGNNIIDADLNLTGATEVNVVDTNAFLRFNGAISGGGSLTKIGVGTLQYGGATANTYTGTTFVNDGELRLAKTVDNGAYDGPLMVGDGTGDPFTAVVRTTGFFYQITNAQPTTVKSDGLLDLGVSGEATGPLTVDHGNVFTNGGFISIDGPLVMMGGNLFGGGTLNVASTADLSDGATISVDDMTVSSDLTASGAGTTINVANTLTVENNLSLSDQAVINTNLLRVEGNISVSGDAQLNATTIDFLGGDSDIDVPTGSVIVINSNLTNANVIRKTGGGELILRGNGTAVVEILINEGIVQVDGDFGSTNIRLSGGRLEGSGQVGSINADGDGGEIKPGASPGLLTAVAFDVTNSATTFIVDINGPVPPVPFPVPLPIQESGYSRLQVNGGPVDLDTNATLAINFNVPPGGGYTPTVGTHFLIIDNKGAAPVLGEFKLADGTVLHNHQIFAVNGTQFQINYNGGDGNDVELIVGPNEAHDDFFVTSENTGLVNSLSANDVNAWVGAQIEIVTQPQHGTVTLLDPNAPPGVFLYTPANDFFGQDSFQYRITTNNGVVVSNTATATIFVNQVLDPPLTQPDFYATNEDVALNDPNLSVLDNDHSQDTPTNAVLTAQLVFGPSHGTLTFNADGTFVYTPDPNWFGVDTFGYRAVDANGLNSSPNSVAPPVELVTITVNPVPDAKDDAFSVKDGSVLNVAAPGVLANDDTQDGATNPIPPLSAILVDGPTKGTLTLNGDGSFVYIPYNTLKNNANVTDTFTYRAFNGINLSDPVTVTITITPDTAPDAKDDAYTTHIGTPLNVPGPGVLANDSDVDGDILSAILVSGPSAGQVFLNPNGSFTYIPNPTFSGTDTFTYQAFDGVKASAPVTVTITVTADNAPVANADTFTTNVTTPLTVVGPGVLANDTDADGNPLTAFLVSQASFGRVVLNADGSFTYIPNEFLTNPPATDSFTYAAFDGILPSAPQTVTINLVADGRPVANADTFTIGEDQVLNVGPIGVLSNDTDPDGHPLTAILQNGATNGTVVLNPDGSFRYTPNANFFGTDSFSYWAFDGILRSAPVTVTINVTAVADAPIARDDSFTLLEDTTLTVANPGILLNDTIVDGTPTVVWLTLPLHGTLTPNPAVNGGFTYTPNADYNGEDSFSYYLISPTAPNPTSAPATVHLTIQGLPDRPTGNADTFTTNEDVPLIVGAPGVLWNDVNNDLPVPIKGSTGLTAVLVDGPLFGSVVLNPDGSFVYTPNANSNNSIAGGPDTFTYVPISPAGVPAAAPVTVTINVRPVNDAPIANNDSYAVTEDDTLFVAPPGILVNDINPDNAPNVPAWANLSAVLVTPTMHGSLFRYNTTTPWLPGVADQTDGGFVYVPNANFVGTDSFTYMALNTITGVFSNVATVTITVGPNGGIVETTVHLDPKSDTGESDHDRITKDNTPTFFGTTEPGLLVVLFVTAEGDPPPPADVTPSDPSAIASTTADANGNYTVTVPDFNALPDGNYHFYVQAYRAPTPQFPEGQPTGLVDAGPLLIDTVAPVVTNTYLAPKTAQVYSTFSDAAPLAVVSSGMSQKSLKNLANYSFAKKFNTNHAPTAFAFQGVQVLPAVDPAADQSVVLKVDKLNRVAHGRYLFAIISGGIQDVAGNALDGEFNGTFPSGDDVPGGNFFGEFLNDGKNNSYPVPTPDFIPYISVPPTPAHQPKKDIVVVPPRNQHQQSAPSARELARQAAIDAFLSRRGK